MPSNLYDYLKYISDDSPTGNSVEEINQVLHTVMDGKTEEEKASIKMNLMKEGFIRYVADLDIINLIAKVYMCKYSKNISVPTDEYKLFYSMAFLASCVGYFNSSLLLDDYLCPVNCDINEDLDQLYAELEERVPNLSSADETSVTIIKKYILQMIRMTARFVPKSNLLDLLFIDMGVDWRKQGNFSPEEIKKLSEHNIPEAENIDQDQLQNELQFFLQRKKTYLNNVNRRCQ